MRKRSYAKVRSILGCSVALVVLSSCGADGSGSGATPPISAPTPAPTPTPTPAPAPTASFVSPETSDSFVTPISGTITDPDGDGTIAGVKLNGNETIIINSDDQYASMPSSPYGSAYQVLTDTYTDATGKSRLLQYGFFTERTGTRTERQLKIFTVNRVDTTGDGMDVASPIKGVLLFQNGDGGASLSSNQYYGVAGDPTAASTRLISGKYTYSGEIVGRMYSYGSTGITADYVGQVTVTVDYAAATAQVSIAVSYLDRLRIHQGCPHRLRFQSRQTCFRQANCAAKP